MIMPTLRPQCSPRDNRNTAILTISKPISNSHTFTSLSISSHWRLPRLLFRLVRVQLVDGAAEKGGQLRHQPAGRVRAVAFPLDHGRLRHTEVRRQLDLLDAARFAVSFDCFHAVHLPI